MSLSFKPEKYSYAYFFFWIAPPAFAHTGSALMFVSIGAGALLGLPGLIWGLWSYQNTQTTSEALDRFHMPCFVLAVLFGLAIGILAWNEPQADWIGVWIRLLTAGGVGGGIAILAMAIGVVCFLIGRLIGGAFKSGIRFFKTMMYG
jgi:hypothetical protein